MAVVVSCPLGQDYNLARWKWRCSRVLDRKLGGQGRDIVGKLAQGEIGKMPQWRIRVFAVVEVWA